MSQVRIELGRFRALCAVFLLFFLIHGINTASATIYVNTTGWWTEGGAFNASAKPLQDAINSSLDGETIVVKDGEYGAVTIKKSVAVRSENGPAFATINGTSYGVAVSISSSNVILSGFTITSKGDSEGGIGVKGRNVTIDHCLVVNCTDYGIHIFDSADVVVRNCKILNNNNAGIGLSNSNSVIIENNSISNHSECGIDTYNLTDSRIFNNSITSNGVGINIFNSINNIIYFNDFNNFRNAWFDVSEPENRWYSLQQMEYIYNGSAYTSYIGNYWSDNENQDSNGDGVGDLPYEMNANNSDPYSLVKMRGYYTLSGVVEDKTPPAITNVSAKPETQEIDRYVNVTCNVYDDSPLNVFLNITHPDSTKKSLLMAHISGTLYSFNTSYSLPGTYTFYIHAVDAAGNTNDSENHTFTIVQQDTTPPEITILSPKNGGVYNTTTIWLNVTANEEIRSWWYSLDNGENTTFIPNATVVVGEGEHEITVYANDTSDNVGNSTSAFYVDLTPPPSITNLTHSAGTTWIRWTWKRPMSDDFNCVLIYLNNVYQTCTNNEFFEATNLNPSTSYTLSTRSCDYAGNVNQTWVNNTASTLSPTTIYVNTTGWWFEGGDFNANSTPIQAAIDNAPEFSKVNVLEGVYHEAVFVYKPLSLRGFDAEINAPHVGDLSSFNSTVFRVTASDVTVEGFRIDGYNNTKGVLLYHANNCRVVNNTIIVNYTGGSYRYGIHLYYSPNCSVYNNRINVSGIQSAGIYNVHSNTTIFGNILNVSGAAAIGVLVYNDYDTPAYIYNNTIAISNVTMPGYGDGYGLLIYYSSGIAKNNTISQNLTDPNAWGVAILGEFKGISENVISGVKTSLKCDGDIKLRGVAESNRPPDPQGWKNISLYLEIGKSDGWAVINITYDEFDGETLELWRYSDGWQRYGWGTKFLDTERKVVGANITSFSIFAPLAAAADTIPPLITFTSPAESVTNRTWVNVTIQSNENLSTAILNWNGVNESMIGSDRVWHLNRTGLSDGDYSYQVFGRDASGNWNSTDVMHLTVDTVPPSYHNTWQNKTSVKAGESVGVYAYWQDLHLNKAWLETNQTVDGMNFWHIAAYMQLTGWSNFTIVATEDDAGKIICWRIHANDTAGNLNTTSLQCFHVVATLSIVDYNPIQTTVYNNAGELRRFNVTLNQIANVSWLINGSSVQTNNSVTYAKFLGIAQLGNWNVTALASNDNGSVSQSWRWKVTAVDNTPPSISLIYTSPIERCEKSNLTVSIVDTNPNYYVAYRNGTAISWGSYPSNPFNISIDTSTVGVFNYTVWANDTLGNSNHSTALITIQDTTPPVLTYQPPTPANGVTLSHSTTSVTINVSANEQIALCILNWNGVNESFPPTNNHCKITKSVSSGEYSFIVYANDTSNNTGYAGSRTFTVSSPKEGGGGGGGTPTPTPTPTPTALPVHNVNTGKDFSTIQQAIDDPNTKDGDTILVDSGNYTENIVVTKSLKIVSAEGAEKTIIKAASNDHIITIRKSGTTISGFTITGAPDHPMMFAGVYVSGVSNCNISGNRIVDNSIGIYFLTTTSSTIADNLIENNDWGIYLVNSESNTITRNVIKHNSGYGVMGGNCNNNLIYNNYFDNPTNWHSYGTFNNKWNVTKIGGENVIGGIYLGGNYWSDYNGKDIDGDGIGDTNVPFGPGDYLPLVNLPVLNLDTGKRFQKIQQAIDDRDTKDGHTILLTPIIYVENLVINKGVKIKSNGAIIRANSGDVVVVVEAKGVTLDGLRIDGHGSRTGINVKGENCHIVNSSIANSSIGVQVSALGTYIENTSVSLSDIGIKIAHPDELVGKVATEFEHLGKEVKKDIDDLVAISNCTIDDNGKGILIEKSFKVNISGNRIEHNKKGVSVKFCEDGLFRDNQILHNDVGIEFEEAKHNLIYNNYFDNNINAIDNAENRWNITKTPGKNIIGGPYLGGNYWSDYRGRDHDLDELGDEPYVLTDYAKNPTSADYLPLMKFPVHNIDLERNYPSIQAAVDDARPGDRIVVDAGVYTENVDVSKPLSITANSSKLGDVVVQAGFSWSPVFRIMADNVTISGFIIRGSDVGITLNNVENCRITKNRVRDNKIGIELLSSTSNKIISNFIVDNELGIKLQDSNNNEIYDNFFSNQKNVESNGNANWWSSVKEWSKRHNPPDGENIIHGDKIKGNYWSDFSPSIHNHIYYPSGETFTGTVKGADILPLMYSRTSAIHISSNDGFTFENGVLYGSGSRYDPYAIEACDFNFTKYPNIVENSIWIENTNAYFEIKNCKIDTALTGIYLKNAKNGKLFNIEFKTGFSGQFMIRINTSSNIDVYKCKFGPVKSTGWTIAALACRDSTSISVIQNDISGVPTGVLLESSSDVLISDNTIYPLFSECDTSIDFKGVSIVSSSNIILRDNTINNATYGVMASSSSEITISGGEFKNNYYASICDRGAWVLSRYADHGGAILMSGIDGASISQITAENNFDGIIIAKSSHIIVQNSTIAQNKNDGIHLKESVHAYITLFNNVITSNTNGLRLQTSSNNSIYSNYFLDNEYGIIFSSSAGNLIYNNYFDNENNVYGSIAGNWLNITKTPGKNIIGGPYLGGNYWSDYSGIDMDGDKLGDIPFHGDQHPLMNLTNIHITSDDEFDSTHGVSGGSGTEDDPYIIEDKSIDATAAHGIWIENTTAYFVIRNVSINAKLDRTNGIYLLNVKNGRIEDVSVNNTNHGIYILNSSNIQLNDSTISNNEIGILAVNSRSIDIYGCIIASNKYGIKFNSTFNSGVENCSFSNNHASEGNKWYGNGIWLDSCNNVDIKGNNITAILDSRYFASHSDAGVLITGPGNGNIYNNTIKGYGFGIKTINSYSNIKDNAIIGNQYGISSKNSALTIERNEMKWFPNNLLDSVGIYLDNSTGTIINNSIEDFRNRHFDAFGNPFWDGKGIYLHNSSGIVANNTVISNGEYGVYVYGVYARLPSSVYVLMNTISDNKVGVGFTSSWGYIDDNFIANGKYGVEVKGAKGDNSNAVTVEMNTIADNSKAGIHFMSSQNYFISKNRIYECEKGIFLENAPSLGISYNALYNNVYDVYGTNSTPVVDSIYTGSDNLTVNDDIIISAYPTPTLDWDRADFGSPILRASILNITSTQFGVSKDVGDMVSVYVHADSVFGLKKEELYLIDLNSTKKIELYSKEISGKTVDKAIAFSILDVNDSTYNMYYEVTDSKGYKVYSLVQIKVKNLDLRITNVTTTFAKRIYSWTKANNLHYTVTSIERFPVNERGSFVSVTVKNNGVRGGFARLEVVLPEYLHNVTQNPVAYVYLNASEERTYTFYVLLTKYDTLTGWEPLPSAFPKNKTIPIKVKLQNFPSYTLADLKQAKIKFKFGPILEVRKYKYLPYWTIYPKTSNPNYPYDGDGDHELEAAEGHHFNFYIVNVGDEAANITMFVYKEIIPCNASKYIRNPRYSNYKDYISHSSETYAQKNTYFGGSDYWWNIYNIENPDYRYYYSPYPYNDDNPDNDNSLILFGMLYPNGTASLPDYYLKKQVRNGWIDWWEDDPARGIYPPADYVGDVITYVVVSYSTGDVPYNYYSASINRIPINVKALDKTFIPFTYSLKNGDVKLDIKSIDANKGTVHFTMENLNDYVYFQYRADGLYGAYEGYKWYHVLPPEYNFNVFAQNAKDPSKSIPHLKTVVGVKWSLWANELKLGMMTLEAVVNIILDEVTGGAVEVEFSDTVMGATNTMLQIMNAVESINNGVLPIVRINGVTFDQDKVDNLAAHGLNQTYFSRLKSGDIDGKMITTFIKAVASDEDLKKIFQREVLKAICKNMGLEEIYKRIEDPNSALEEDFDNFQEELLDYLVENKKLTKDQAEKIGKAVDAAKIFVDLGEWAYNNYNAMGVDEITINVLDPPSNFTVEVEERETNYFGGYYPTQTNAGNGSVTIEFLNDSLVRIDGVYTTKPENMPLDKIREMRISLKGERIQGVMVGDVDIEIIPEPSEMLNVVSAFRNPSVPKLMVSSQFMKIESITAITEGDEIVIHAHGVLRCNAKDVAINGTTLINDSIVFVRIEKTGYYSENGSVNLSFGPVIGVSLNNTKLSVLNAKFESDLPFKKVGNAYYLESLPKKLTLKVESEKAEFWYSVAPVALIAVVIAAIAVAVLFKRR